MFNYQKKEMIFLLNLFYAIGVYPLYMEIKTIIFTKHDFDKEKEIVEHIINEEEVKLNKNDKLVLLMDQLYLVWIFLGLFTTQWYLFMTIFLFLFAKILYFDKNIENKKTLLKIYWVDAFLSVIIIGYAIFNHFSYLFI